LQPLRYVLTLTGGVLDAYLTTVKEYLHQMWPEEEHTFAFMDTITSRLLQDCSKIIASDGIQFNPVERIVTVEGSRAYIVAVVQQLAWFGAVCRASVGSLALCYTSVSERVVPDEKFIGFLSDISYEVSSSGVDVSTSRWHGLVGNSVIATDYPILPREHGEIGPQISMEIMVALGKIPLAMNFGGGYVLKGRSFVMAPLEKKGSSDQWHLLRVPAEIDLSIVTCATYVLIIFQRTILTRRKLSPLSAI
jgi:hypothetical protein